MMKFNRKFRNKIKIIFRHCILLNGKIDYTTNWNRIAVNSLIKVSERIDKKTAELLRNAVTRITQTVSYSSLFGGLLKKSIPPFFIIFLLTNSVGYVIL